MKRKETAERRKEKRDRRTEKETNERDQKKGITQRKMTEARTPAGPGRERTRRGRVWARSEEDVKYLFNLLANFGESFIEEKKYFLDRLLAPKVKHVSLFAPLSK